MHSVMQLATGFDAHSQLLHAPRTWPHLMLDAGPARCAFSTPCLRKAGMGVHAAASRLVSKLLQAG